MIKSAKALYKEYVNKGLTTEHPFKGVGTPVSYTHLDVYKRQVNGRPMLPQTMEFITDMGTICQSCMKDEISVDEFCEKAQGLVEKYSK